MTEAYLKSPPGAETIVVEGAFRASVDKVWRAWTEPDRMIRWFGENVEDFSSVDVDLRVGGRWRCEMSRSSAKSERIEGEYLVVERHARLVFTWSHVRELASGDVEATPQSTVSVTFRTIEGGTEVALRHENIQTEGGRKGVSNGWNNCFARLAGLVADR